MRKVVTVILAGIGVGAVLALGFAAAAIWSSSSSAASASTSETTATHETSTTETSTTEQPSSTKYSSVLGTRAEVPTPNGVPSGAGGTFSVTLKHSGATYSVTWKLTFRKLTGKALAAHIHRGKPGKAGAVLLPLCGPCRSGQVGKASLSAAASTALTSDSAYVNVHTTKNAAGEIRGQIRKVK